MYPRTWLAVSAVGLGRGDVVAVGYLMDLAFFVALAFVARPRGWPDVLLTFLVGLSPGIMLAVDRANFDLVAFAMLSTLVALRGTTVGVWAGGGLVLLAGALKIYPLVALAPWAWENRRRRTCGHRDGRRRARRHRDRRVGVARRLGQDGDARPGADVAVLLDGGAAPVRASRASARDRDRPCGARGRCRAAIAYGRARVVVRERRFDVLLGGDLLLFCFFARTNYDYRWVFLALVLPAAWNAGSFGRAVVGASAVVLWTEALTFWVGNLLGGGPLMAVVIAVAPLVDHAASWIVVLGCTALAAGTAPAER